MIITKYFVFLHIPKTGGNFLTQVCAAHLPGDYVVRHQIHDHAGAAAIPEEYRHLPRFALIRNPWDWYVSWYHFLKEVSKDPPVFWFPISDSGQADFGTTIANLCEARFNGVATRVAKLLTERDVGLLTLHYQEILGSSLREKRVSVGRVESLREDFLEFLEVNDIPVPIRFVNAVREMSRTNVSEHGPYREYYTEELASLIRHKDREIIATYGYEY